MSNTSNTLNIIITAPAEVAESEREAVTNAVSEILFGQDGTQGFDRVRDELLPALEKQGIDTDKLQELSRPRLIGGCRPNAREVRLSRRFASAQIGHGLREGTMSLQVNFYDDKSVASGKLAVAIEVDPSLGAAINKDKSLVQEISDAVFGTCSLHPDAQAYLDVRGVDLDALGKEARITPPTTRIGRTAAKVLKKNGIEPHQLGEINLHLFQQSRA